MNPDEPTPHTGRPSLLRNWLSLTGLVVVVGSLFSFFLLFLIDALAHTGNPYVGILTYVVAPGFFFFGTVVTFIGAIRERRKLGTLVGVWPKMVVDLSRPRDRKKMAFFLTGTVVFLLVSAMGSYHTYHITESVQFCGEACHTVMKPELVSYQHGPHARVACVECHIGSGATWFVKSKLSGSYQLYAVAFKKYPTPIPTPIKNLRPAQDTCEQCHWPKKFTGNLDRTYHHYLGDETNTPYSVRLLLKVGGSDPTHGPVGGIHWHMNVANKVEYYAADESRQQIPWVRITDEQGVVKVYRTRNFTNEPPASEIRRMDCMDCHNRPAHTLQTPNAAVDLAMSLGQIDPTLKWIKTNAVFALTQEYTNETEALEGIATHLSQQYPNEPRIRPAIATVQRIYKDNFFPEMKANWRAYPNNVGHMTWQGCFRCHDGLHKTADGKQSVQASDCSTCHTILAQGAGKELEKMNPEGLTFEHPGGELDENPTCNDCHDGTL